MLQIHDNDNDIPTVRWIHRKIERQKDRQIDRKMDI
jgi:hypothetical protein